MSTSKREGAAAIAYQAAPGTAAAAPVFTIICDDIHVPGEPVTAERTNSISAECLGMTEYGKDVTFSVDGIEPNAELAGYLLWLFGGGYSRAVGVHTISQEFNSKYFTLFKDQGAVFETGLQVLTGIGCRADSLVVDQQAKAFAKVSLSGLACDKGDYATPLEPAISLVADDAPMSWAALRAGDAKLGYSSLTRTTDDDITGIKTTLNRTHTYSGYTLGSDQPDGITEGAREVLVEYTRDFNGDAAALAEYAEYVSGTGFVSLEFKWLMGVNYVSVHSPP